MIRFLLSFTVFISFSYTVFSKEYYELRTYKLNSPEKAAAFDKMMAAAVPLLATTELKSIGVFKARGDKSGDKNWRYVLKSCSSLDAIAASSSALANEGFLEQARDYLSYAKSDPSFSRISISTFVAFDGFPELISPQKDKGGKRYFELRTYESHNELKAYMKVKMFNDGELDIFADVGLNGVFFGRALSGENFNGGERLRLEIDSISAGILDFEYEDEWYPETDGTGASLVVIDDSVSPLDWGLKDNWSASIVAPSGSYLEWVESSFGQEFTGQTSKNDDPDKDGISNLLEFVFALDPTKSDPEFSMPKLSREAGGLLLTYTVTKFLDGIEIKVQLSDDLIEWTDAEESVSVEMIAEDETIRTYEAKLDNVIVGGVLKRFMRLSVE